jgi:hypothetical protein
MKKSLIACIPALLLAAPAFAEGPAARPPPEPGHEIDVEIVEQNQGRQEATSFRLAVPGTGAAAQISAMQGEVLYTVKVRQDGGTAYELELDREIVRRGASTHDLRVATSRLLVPGQREVMSAVKRADGSRTEVALTVRP